MDKKNIIIAIAGASGSGKTTLAHYLHQAIGPKNSVVLCQDSYYKDLSHLTAQERETNNFDHPDSIDFDQLQNDLWQLKNNNSIKQPIYDFEQHCRSSTTQTISPSPYIIIEGTLILSQELIRNLIDYSIYLEVDLDLCLLRRINRDTKERGRSIESIHKQYSATVVPMYHKFVKPSKQFAQLQTSEKNFNILSKKIIEQLKK